MDCKHLAHFVINVHQDVVVSMHNDFLQAGDQWPMTCPIGRAILGRHGCPSQRERRGMEKLKYMHSVGNTQFSDRARGAVVEHWTHMPRIQRESDKKPNNYDPSGSKCTKGDV